MMKPPFNKLPLSECLNGLVKRRACYTLKTLASLNKEVKPFFLGDNSIWHFLSFSSLSDYSIWRS